MIDEKKEAGDEQDDAEYLDWSIRALNREIEQKQKLKEERNGKPKP